MTEESSAQQTGSQANKGMWGKVEMEVFLGKMATTTVSKEIKKQEASNAGILLLPVLSSVNWSSATREPVPQSFFSGLTHPNRDP